MNTQLRLGLALLALVFGCARPPSATPLGGTAAPEVASNERVQKKRMAPSNENDKAEQPSSEEARDGEDSFEEAAARAKSTKATEASADVAIDVADGVADVDGTTFTDLGVAVGDRVSTLLTLHVTGSMDVAGLMSSDFEFDAKEADTTEYLKVKDGEPVVYRVEFGESWFKGTMMGEKRDEPSPLAGNAYIIDESGSDTTWKRADGRSLSLDEEAKLADRYGESDAPTDLDPKDFDFIPNRPIQQGERLPLPEKVRDEISSKFPNIRENVTLRFDGVRTVDGLAVGVFSIEGGVEGELEGADFSVRPLGEVWVAVNGKYPVRFDLRGDLSAEVDTGDMSMSGDGRFELLGSATYDFAER